MPHTIVIFGASGDLTSRKLIPALYHLVQKGRLPCETRIVGFSRTPLEDQAWRAKLQQTTAEYVGDEFDEDSWRKLAENVHYFPGDVDDSARVGELAAYLDQLEQGETSIRIYYLATAPQFFEPTIDALGRAGLACESASPRRIVVEKPFGTDLASARQLNARLHTCFAESQIFRIDHYLGKETVQNILVFRLANGIFEPIWNRHYVDHVQITVAEDLGVEGRGGYYETAGVMRDMIQNHMLQLLALVAMEPPIAFAAQEVRNEKVKVLQAIRPILPEEVEKFVVRAQYSFGSFGGQQVPGYLQEPGVVPDSRTETYVALKLYLDNWRWAGVPFFLRSGKRLPKRATEIAIHFKSAPHLLFGAHTAGLEANVLALRIQPDEGITLRFAAKLPGAAIQVRTVNMDFRYGTSFGKPSPEAYERLIWDCMLGDSTLFTRRDEVEASWQFVTPILAGWQQRNDQPLPQYPAGTWGPPEAEAFIAPEGRRWRRV